MQTKHLLAIFTILTSIAAQADTIYITQTDNKLIKFAPDFVPGGTGSLFYDFTATFAFLLEGVAIDPAGNLAVSDSFDHYIYRFSPAGAFLSAYFPTGPFSPLRTPRALAYDSFGNLFDCELDGIVKITPAGVISAFANLSVPTDLAFDSAGNLYAAVSGQASLKKLTPAGGVGTDFGSGLISGSGVAFDRFDNLYVSDLGDDTIKKFTPAGVMSVFASTGLNDPRGLDFDEAGNLYVANSGNFTVDRFTPDGVRSVFATTTARPFAIAIQPPAVPEPSALAALAAGALMLLGFRRRG